MVSGGRRPASDERQMSAHPLISEQRRFAVGQTFAVDVETVRVEGYYEVLALHRYLFECKGEDFSSVYAGSPFIAAIQNRLADALEVADPGSGWTTWRAADGHQQRVDGVRQHLLSTTGRWNGMSRERRRAYVQDLLAPLRISEDLLAELVVQAASVPVRSTDGAAKDG
jgi:hypothetical protein